MSIDQPHRTNFVDLKKPPAVSCPLIQEGSVDDRLTEKEDNHIACAYVSDAGSQTTALNHKNLLLLRQSEDLVNE